MILQSLVRYFETLKTQGKLAEPGWSRVEVTARIVLDKEGNLIGIVSTKSPVPKGKKIVYKSAVMFVPEQNTSRSSGISPNFLCDNSTFLFGVDEKWKPKISKVTEVQKRQKIIDATKKRTLNCFEASKRFHHQILESVASPYAKALLNFFDHWDPKQAEKNEILRQDWSEVMKASNMVFQIDGRDLNEVDEIKKAWDCFYSRKYETDTCGQCLVTGKKNQPIARVHPKIKGIKGKNAQSSGTSLVSFNAPALESYGHNGQQGLNAPTSEYAAFAYTAALNYLISSEHCRTVGDTTIVYWSEHGEEIYQDGIDSYFSNERGGLTEKELDDIIRAVLKGETFDIHAVQVSPDEPFYFLGLTPNKARLSVRFFYANRFGNVVQCLESHRERMKIVKPSWEMKNNISVMDVIKATVNPKAKDAVPSSVLTGSLLRSVLSGSKYPEALYRNILLRIFADSDNDKITYIKAAFIKAYLLKNFKERWDGVITMNVNPNCKEKAYVLGRLFAVLEGVQREASHGINTTVTDKYFNSACATPAVVFPTLLKLANIHLSKLAKEKKGLQVFFEKKIGNLLSMISMPDEGTPIPKRLTLEEQGVFVLGYYQERFTKKEDKGNG